MRNAAADSKSRGGVDPDVIVAYTVPGHLRQEGELPERPELPTAEGVREAGHGVRGQGERHAVAPWHEPAEK